MPNRLVYRTILDVHYRDHEHPPYHQLEGYGYTYLGSMVESLNKVDLYLYKCAADDPLLAAKYDSDRSSILRGDLDSPHPVLQEARRRADASGSAGLLRWSLLEILCPWATTHRGRRAITVSPVFLAPKGAEGDRNGFHQGPVQALRLCLPFAGRLLSPSGFSNIGPLKKLSSDASFDLPDPQLYTLENHGNLQKAGACSISKRRVREKTYGAG